MKLRLLPEAIEQIAAARAWWLANRGKAPHLFDEELADVLERVAGSSTAGQRVALSSGRSIRRMLMTKAAFHLYNEVVGSEVWVMTVWGAVRGDRPDL